MVPSLVLHAVQNDYMDMHLMEGFKDNKFNPCAHNKF